MTTNASEATPYLLVVEDNPDLRHGIEEHFRLLDYRVAGADNGANALKMVMETDFDAVICDMVMPHMPGDMFYLAVQRVRPHLCERFIFITGHGGTAGIKRFLSEMGERVLSKPFNIEDLAETVRRLLSEKPEKKGGGSGSGG